MIDAYSLITIIYIVIGIILMLYWWNKDYAYNYETAKIRGEVQDSAACLLMLGLITFWPLKLIHKIIKKFFKI